MRIDRILIDILDWIRRSFYWQAGKVEKKPFEEIESLPGRYGRLVRVVRDTDRAVRTWEFHPYKRKNEPPPWIIRVCCDFLELVPGQKATRKRSRHSHRLQVLLVSPELNSDGSFDFEQLFDRVYDWQVDSNRDKFAIPITDCIAKQLLYTPLRQMDWLFQSESCGKEQMGANYTGLTNRYDAGQVVSGVIIDPEPITPEELRKRRKDKS